MLAAERSLVSNSAPVRNWWKTLGLFVKIWKLSCVYFVMHNSGVQVSMQWDIQVADELKGKPAWRTSGSPLTWNCIICIHACVGWLCSRMFIGHETRSCREHFRPSSGAMIWRVLKLRTWTMFSWCWVWKRDWSQKYLLKHPMFDVSLFSIFCSQLQGKKTCLI